MYWYRLQIQWDYKKEKKNNSWLMYENWKLVENRTSYVLKVL
jgi:hypothetical protein